MKKALFLLLLPALAFADRLGSLRSSADVLLTTQAVSGGASSLAVTVGVNRSSPTTDVIFNPNQATGVISGSSITVDISGLRAVGLDTATLKTGLVAVGVDTASLKTGVVAVGIDTATLKTGLVAVGVDTAAIRSSLNSEVTAVGTDTTTLKSNILSVGLATATLKTGLVAVGIDTATLKTGLVAVGVDTATLKTITVNIGVSTNTLGQNFPVSLSTNVVGSLPDSNLSANVGLLNSTQTWSGQNNWTTPAQSTFSYGVTLGTLTITGADAWDLAETTVPVGQAGASTIYASSVTHTLHEIPNNEADFSIVISSINPVAGNKVVWSSYSKVVDGGPDIGAIVPSTFSWILNYPVTVSSSLMVTGGSTTFVGAVTHIGFSTATFSNAYYDYTGSSVALGFIKASNGYGTSGQMLTSGGSTSSATWTTPTAGGGGGASSLAVTVGVSRSSPTSDAMFNANHFTGSVSGSSITVSIAQPFVSSFTASTSPNSASATIFRASGVVTTGAYQDPDYFQAYSHGASLECLGFLTDADSSSNPAWGLCRSASTPNLGMGFKSISGGFAPLLSIDTNGSSPTGSTATIAAGAFVANGTAWIGGASGSPQGGTNNPQLQVTGGINSQYAVYVATSSIGGWSVGFDTNGVVSMSSGITTINGSKYYWPSTQSSNYLKNDGSGNLSWAATPAGSGGGGSPVAVTIGVNRSSPTTDVMFTPNQATGVISGSTITVDISGLRTVGLDTATLKTGIVAVGVDTASLKTGLVAVGVDTASLKTGLVAVGVSTQAIIQYFPVSLSTGVTSSLPAASIAAGSLGASVIASSLAAVNTVPGSYTNSNITINAQGQVTTASNGTAGSGSSFMVAIGTGGVGGYGGTITSSSTISQVVLFDSMTFKGAFIGGTTVFVTPNYSSITAQGFITAASLGALTGNQSITLSGDASGSGTTAITVTDAARQANITTLAASSVTATGNLEVDGWATHIGSMTINGGTGLGVKYNVNAGSVTGAGLTNCGDSSHAVSWNSSTNLFGCQSVTGSAATPGGPSGNVQFNQAGSFAGTNAITVWASSVTFSTPTYLSGGIVISSGINMDASNVITGTTTITSTMSVVLASCTTRGASPQPWFTLTLPPVANGEMHTIYDVGADSCSIRIQANGADLIESTGTLQLDARSQHASLHGLGSNLWGSGEGGIQYTPWAAFTTQDDVGTFSVGVSSQVTMCPIQIREPVTLMGFRTSRPTASGTNRAVFAIYDKNRKFVVETATVTLANAPSTYLTGAATQLAPGYYYAAFTAVNTLIAISGSNTITDQKIFCGNAGTSTTGMDLSTFVPSNPLTGAGTTYPAFDLIFNGGLQGF